MTDDGSYLEVDGRPAVRFERTFSQPLERVWRAVTEPAELAHWFPSPEVSYEPRVGGAMKLGGDPNLEQDVPATVLVWEPPHRFAFQWGPDELRFTLTEEEDGSCRLELLNVLAEANTAARNAAGWEVCLAELAHTVEGRPDEAPHAISAPPWQPLYDKYVAAGLPSGAPIPSADS